MQIRCISSGVARGWQQLNTIRHVYYRGSLSFCNYSCRYCPFSKNRGGGRQLARDEKELSRFVEEIGRERFCGTVQIVPYGEALIHKYYWKGLAELSALSGIQAAGVQSNFSFPVEEMLRLYERAGGYMDKLRLWGTFHPEMTTVEEFLGQCRKLVDAGIRFCVGAVGVPEHLERLRKLRAGLDGTIYMWINKMDGMGRKYTDRELQAFLDLDANFGLELRHFPANVSACAQSALILGNGDVFPCVLCREKMGNLYEDSLAGLQQKTCVRSVCDCFLSYGGRSDLAELDCFGPHAQFRIVPMD